MAEPPFYRDVSAALCQGDIFERVPLLYLTDMPRLLEEVHFDGKDKLLQPGALLDPLHLPEKTSGLPVSATCDFTRAILLTYDCEIDKPPTKHLTLALIRPLDPSMPAQSRQIIRENRKMSVFYLPTGGHSSGESLVDFMRVSVVPKEWLQAAPRIACLSQEARQAMLFQLIRFLCRIDLTGALAPPPV